MRKNELEKLLYKTVADAIGVKIDESAPVPQESAAKRRVTHDTRDARHPQRAAA